MNADWTTFILEVINFLVLLWILNRFLYQPVLNVIVQRKAAIQQFLSDAEAARNGARVLEEQFKNRLVEWEQEQEKTRARLHEEIAAERARSLEALRAELDQERQKADAVQQQRMNDFVQQAEVAAIAQGRTFATRLLARFSGPELERSIVEMVMQDLAQLPDKQMQMLRSVPPAALHAIKVTSAYPLDERQRADLVQACRMLASRDVRCEFLEDRQLIAGLRISFASWMFRANVQDELSFFGEPVRHA